MKYIIKYTFLLCGLALLISWKTPVISHDTELDAFIAEFVKAVKQKDEKRVMQMLDKDYVIEQHDNFLKGNTRQFLDELFSGFALNTHEFKTIKFKKIKKIQFTKVQQEHGSAAVSFLIQNKKVAFIAELFLIDKTVNGKRVFGLRGAVG